MTYCVTTTRSYVQITCCKTASLGLNYTINWDATCLVLSSVLAFKKHSINIIIHSTLPLGENISTMLVWIMWTVRGVNGRKYALINYMCIFSKKFEQHRGKKAFHLWSRKRSVSLNFSFTCTGRIGTTVWGVLCQDTSGMRTLHLVLRRKKTYPIK